MKLHTNRAKSEIYLSRHRDIGGAMQAGITLDSFCKCYIWSMRWTACYKEYFYEGIQIKNGNQAQVTEGTFLLVAFDSQLMYTYRTARGNT